MDRTDTKALWRRLLAERGILEVAEQVGWQPNGNGWQYPLYGADGLACRLPDGQPIERWKNYSSELTPKYLWRPRDLGSARPKYYLLPGVKRAIADAGGRVFLASGEPDVLAFRAAGYHNVLCWFGEENVPETLAADLITFNVIEAIYFPDLDATGTHSAQKVAQALKDTPIIFRAFQLPDDLGERGDINRLWKSTGFDRGAFNLALTSCKALSFQVAEAREQPVTIRQPDHVDGHHQAYVEKALCDEIAILSSTSGNRNNQLNKSSFALGQLVAAGALNRSEVENALLNAALSTGLTEREARATIKSGLNAGDKEPRSLPAAVSARPIESVGSVPSTPVPNGARPDKFPLLSLARLADMPETNWLIPELMPAQSLVTLFGQSGTGKSFVALDFALRIAQQTTVVYVAAEGIHGYLNRVEAWCKINRSREGAIFFVATTPQLLNAADVTEFVNAIMPASPSLVILDTLARCMVGGDENSTRDMGLLIEACGAIEQATGATVLLVHHTGKNGGSERGSSALRGACDVMIELSNDDGHIKLTCSKMKDAPEFQPLQYQLLPVELAPGRSSCAVIRADKVVQTLRDPLTSNQLRVLEGLSLEVFLESGAKTAALIQTSGVSGGSVYRVLSVLKRLGYVTQAKTGDPYFITKEGLDNQWCDGK